MTAKPQKGARNPRRYVVLPRDIDDAARKQAARRGLSLSSQLCAYVVNGLRDDGITLRKART
jgi:hypothetical protein